MVHVGPSPMKGTSPLIDTGVVGMQTQQAWVRMEGQETPPPPLAAGLAHKDQWFCPSVPVSVDHLYVGVIMPH